MSSRKIIGRPHLESRSVHNGVKGVNRNQSKRSNHVSTPRYDYSDYEVDNESGAAATSPIGWICNAAKEAFFPPSDRENRYIQQKKYLSSTPRSESSVSRNESEESRRRINDRHDTNGTDDEVSDGEEIVPRFRNFAVSNNNGVISRTPQNLFPSKDISLPSLKLYTPGGPYSEYSPSAHQAPQESRIVAPHVGKLAPGSVVEIRLQSTVDCVAILCSVDVLKMRSGFFGEILDSQESEIKHLKSSDIWRDPISIPEISPFEAAAFLESLHEGRSLFKEEWNFSWARLSVHWLVEDLLIEYVSQIENHINKLSSAIQNNCWRTNPSILTGFRVAVFRKGATQTPTVLLGSVVEASASTGYSKIRVAFDSEKNSSQNPEFHSFGYVPTIGPKRNQSNLASNPTTPTGKNSTNSSYEIGKDSSNIGDVSEPFWIQKEGQSWMDPDENYILSSKKFITVTDKRIFWEMARSIIDLPQLAGKLKCGINNPKDIASLMKKEEFRVLWSLDAPAYLPKDAATELLSAAYCVQQSNQAVENCGI